MSFEHRLRLWTKENPARKLVWNHHYEKFWTFTHTSAALIMAR
jgi:hypothetical protein